MMRVFWEEWRSGGEFSTLRILPALALGTVLGLLMTQFQPAALLEALAAALLVGGVLSGTQRWSRVLAREWVSVEHIRPLRYAAGKITGLVFLGLVWSAFLLPPFILVALSWGLPWERTVFCLAWAFTGGLAAQALSHLVTWWRSDFQRIAGMILVVLWLGVTLQLKALQAFNPLWQIWHLMQDPVPTFDAALVVVLGGTLFLWALVVLILKRAEFRP